MNQGMLLVLVRGSNGHTVRTCVCVSVCLRVAHLRVFVRYGPISRVRHPNKVPDTGRDDWQRPHFSLTVTRGGGWLVT